MDPLTSLLESLDQAASTRSPSAQDVLAHANALSKQVAPQRTTTAPSEQVAPQRTTNAPSELVVPRRTTSAPVDNRRLTKSLTTSTLKNHRYHQHPQRSSNDGHQAQVILLLILIPGCDTVPVERCAPGWFVSTRSRLPFHSQGSARLPSSSSVMGDRGTMEPAATGRSGGDTSGALS